ncbi:MAG: hypothetical protein KKH52_01325 [Nanoarchaeota archaeon]|nr:hypothetical protein [Nanoarchaeota archaeon]MBU1623213.1 hypothetical protein [Nanoarchaeota archaeon]MBU1974018.1 hypothetical protein [Nanoarchaeota archaeon]
MTKHKTAHRKRTHKYTPRHHTSKPKEKEPNYMVQINEPNVLRKDILEGLKETIIFMQGYAEFKTIQIEKVDLYGFLKDQIKELQGLVNNLKKYLPQGKLELVVPGEKKRLINPVAKTVNHVPPSTRTDHPTSVASELDELEISLKDIESQLQTLN